MHHLAGVPEIARLLRLTPARVYQLLKEDPGFPEPVAELQSGRVWKTVDVLRWTKKTGRTIKAG